MSMTLIETIELSSSSSSITFSSIPGDYDDLKIYINGRSTRVSTSDAIILSINGSTGNQSWVELENKDSGADTSSGSGGFVDQSLPGASSTANTFGVSSIYIAGYSSSAHKTMTTDGHNVNNSTTFLKKTFARIWTNTASITSLQFECSVAIFDTGTVISLYGISSDVS